MRTFFPLLATLLAISSSDGITLSNDGPSGSSNRYHHSASFDTLVFEISYDRLDTSQETYNANVSLIVFKDFFNTSSIERGFAESGSYSIIHESSDENSNPVTQSYLRNAIPYEAGGLTNIPMGNVDGDDLFLNLEDIFVKEGDILRISSANFEFSTVSSTLPLQELNGSEVLLTNSIGQILSYAPMSDPDSKILAGYDFDSGAGIETTSATLVDSQVTASTFEVGPGLLSVFSDSADGLAENLDAEGRLFGTANPISFGGSQTAFGFSDQGNVNDLATSLSAEDYLTFTISPEESIAMTLTDLTFRMRVNQLHNGAEYWTLFSSVGGFTQGQEIATGLCLASDVYQNFGASLPTSQFENLVEPVTFRLYLSGGSANTESETLVDKVLVIGQTVELPSLLAGYDFDDGTGTETLEAVSNLGLTASPFGVGSGLTEFISNNANGLTEDLDAEGNVFGSTNPISFGGARNDLGFSDQNNANNLSGAIASNDYMTITLTPSEVHQLNFTNFSFRTRVNDLNNSAERWALFSSLDGFSSGREIASGRSTVIATYIDNIIDLSDAKFQNIRTPIEFRLYIYGGNGSTSSATLFDKVIFNGEVTAAPFYEFQGYERWAWENGLYGIDQSYDNQSLDQDGYNNLQEYILLGDPRADDLIAIRPHLLGPEETDESITLHSYSFFRRTESTNWTSQVVQYSNDFATWNDLPTTGSMIDPRVTIRNITGDIDQVIVEIRPEFEDDQEKVFLRLAITPNP